MATETLWLDDPKQLLQMDLAIHPESRNKTWNSITRAILMIAIAGVLGEASLGPSFPILLLMMFALYYGPFLYENLIHKVKEPFRSEKGIESPVISSAIPTGTDLPYDVTSGMRASRTTPTANNPFMNVLMDEIKYNPTRPPAMSTQDPLVKVKLEDYFKVQWTSDPTDVFGRTQSQRQFYTMPSTSIPNDRASYQNWLYLIPGKTCKEGGSDQCVPGTNGGVVPWLSQPN